MKKFTLMGLLTVSFLFSGCEIMKNTHESSFLNCRTKCQTEGMQMNVDQTKLTGKCRCTTSENF